MTSLVAEMFKQTCRTCLSIDGEMVSIFSSSFYVKQLSNKIMAFTKVEISNNDALPQVICKKCMFMADSLYCFKQQCESADSQLRSLIQRGSNKDISPYDEEKLGSEGSSDRTHLGLAVAASNGSEESTIGDKKLERDAENLVERRQDSEDDYVVEYISDKVRIEVENSLNKRQEAERRISMVKVSQSIKNLKDIEVLPISDIVAARNGRSCNVKKEEIVVFPVKVQKKRRKTIETIVLNDSPSSTEGIRLPLEINEVDVKREDSRIYGKHKKLSFPTFRKVVKIDRDEPCVEPKKEIIKDLDNQQSFIKHDDDFLIVSDDSCRQKTQFRYSEIRIGEKGMEINSEKQDLELIQGKFQVDPKDEKEPVEISASLELKYERNPSKATDNFQDHELAANSRIGCVINETDDRNIDDIDRAYEEEDLENFENTNDSSENIFHYRTDQSNEVFVENKIRDAGYNCSTFHNAKTGASSDFLTMSCFKPRKIEREKSKDNSKFNSQVTPLSALLSVDSSGEENRFEKMDLKIYQSNESDRVEGKTEDNFSTEDRNPASSLLDKTKSSNTKFYQCAVCSIHFASMPALSKHSIQVHLTDESSYFQDNHVEEHNVSKPDECNFFPKTFTLKRNLKRYLNQYKLFHCRICMKRFNEKSSLESHVNLRTGNSRFTCKTCNVSFNNKTSWRRHVMTIHEKLTVVVCKFCNKELPDKRSLRVHTRVHTGDRPYRCPHCDKCFTQQCNLNTHIHCHLNDRLFRCPHCGKGFNQRGTLNNHILTHTGEKPHKCKECDASFTVLSALKRHMWVHTDKDRPYNCRKCKLQFVGFYELRKHLRIRHGEVLESENPRVERVVTDDQNKDEGSLDSFGRTDSDSNEIGLAKGVRSFKLDDDSRMKITTKENNSLDCNATVNTKINQ